MTMDVEKGAAASSSDEEEEGDHPEQVAICPPFAKGITSLEAGAHLKTLPYKVVLRPGSDIDLSLPFSLVDLSVPGETSSESPEEAAVRSNQFGGQVL